MALSNSLTRYSSISTTRMESSITVSSAVCQILVNITLTAIIAGCMDMIYPIVITVARAVLLTLTTCDMQPGKIR
eukprot:7155775-Ditylum_brightwellii.AAC.1